MEYANIQHPLLGNGSVNRYERDNSMAETGYNNNVTPTDTNASMA
jgi:hypothetical protein